MCATTSTATSASTRKATPRTCHPTWCSSRFRRSRAAGGGCTSERAPLQALRWIRRLPDARAILHRLPVIMPALVATAGALALVAWTSADHGPGDALDASSRDRLGAGRAHDGPAPHGAE